MRGVRTFPDVGCCRDLAAPVIQDLVQRQLANLRLT
jgi:hypothetical protein